MNVILLLLKDILAGSASICTIVQFLSGMLVCNVFIKNKSTGDASGLAFVTCFVSCTLWLLYGSLIHDKFITFVNLFGLLLQLLYICIYYIYTIKKNVIQKQIFCAIAFTSILFYYWSFEKFNRLIVEDVGFVCCAITIIFFASPLTMLGHVIKVKSAESLPFPVIMASFITSLQWALYGYTIEDLYVLLPNFLGCILSGFQLALFIVYPSRKSKEELLL